MQQRTFFTPTHHFTRPPIFSDCKVPQNCNQLFELGFAESGMYRIVPSGVDGDPVTPVSNCWGLCEGEWILSRGKRQCLRSVSLLLLFLERFELFIELVIYVLYHRQYFFHRFLSFLSNYTSNLCEVTFGQITIKVFVKFLVKFSFA